MSFPFQSKVCKKLGVKTHINACNWSTQIGGTYLDPEVIEAMAEVSKCFLDLRELLDKACIRISELCKVDAAYITTGAAAGLVMTTAACIAGKDPIKWSKLPFSDDPPINGKNQIIMQLNHSTSFDPAFAVGGGRLVKVGSAAGTKIEAFEAAINDQTAGITAGYHYNLTPRGCIPYEILTKISKKYDLPSFVDFAGAFPPYENLYKLTDWGFDISIISGGKGIRGPQGTGLILAKGQRGIEMIEEIKKNSAPNSSGFGRGFKVSKESIVGLLTALELILNKDEEEEYQKQLVKVEYMAKQLEGIKGVNVSVIPNDGKTYEHPYMARVPTVRIKVDKDLLGLTTVKSIYDAMESGEPGIFIRFPRLEDLEFGPFTSEASVFLFPYYLRNGEEKIVVKKMKNVLTTHPWKNQLNTKDLIHPRKRKQRSS